MRKIIYIIFVILAVALNSCGIFKGGKPSEPKPEWVKKRPQTNMYYVGVGAQKMEGYSPDAYTQNAKSSALNDLSSDISVDISSSSVISTIETDYNLTENYQRTIKASTDKILKDYEVVDTWKGENNYWVYVRLSKMAYEQQKAKRKKAALNSASGKFKQAREYKKENDYYQSVNSYIAAFSDLSEYLAESTSVEINGEQMDLATKIYEELVDIINDVFIKSKENPLTVTSGKSIPSNMMKLYVVNENNKPLSNMPLKLIFSGSGLMDNSLKTNQKGEASVDIDKIFSNKQEEQLYAELDMIKLSRLTKNIFIRTLIKKIPPPSYTLSIYILSPTIYVETQEKSFGKPSGEKVLYNALMQAVARNNMRVLEHPDKADYFLKLESDTKETITSSYQKTVELSYVITVKDDTNRLLYRKSEDNIEGYGSNYAEAEIEALDEGKNTIIRKNFNQIKRAVFK